MAAYRSRALSKRERIECHIERRTFGRVRSLQVEVRGRRVILYGHSDTYYAKQLAQHGVLDVVPSAQVDNAIEVR